MTSLRTCLVLLCFLGALSTAQAQWVPCGTGIRGGDISCLAKSDNLFLAASSNGGVAVSHDDGQSWAYPSNTLSDGQIVYALSFKGSHVFAGASFGIYRSDDNAQSWQKIQNGLPDSTPVTSIVVYSSTIFIGTYGRGVYASTDDGNSWSRRSFGLGTGFIYTHSLCVLDTVLYLGTLGGGVYVSGDEGQNWLPRSLGLRDRTISCLDANSTTVFVGTASGDLYHGTNASSTWQQSPDVPGVVQINTMCTSGEDAYASSFGFGLLRSTDNGASWSAVNNGFSAQFAYTLCSERDSVWAGTEWSSVFLSTNRGSLWTEESRLNNVAAINALYLGQNDVFCDVGGGGLYRSANQGDSWLSIERGMLGSAVSSLIQSSTSLLAVAYREGVYFSSDNGSSWLPRNNGLPPNALPQSMVQKANALYLCTTNNGIFRSDDNASSWQLLNSQGFSPTSTVSQLYVVNDKLVAQTLASGLYLSQNNGLNWIAINSGLPNLSLTSVCTTNSLLIVGVANAGVYISSDNGQSWHQKISGLGNLSISSLCAYSTNILACTPSGIYLSTDAGDHWAEKDCGFNDFRFLSSVMDASRVFVGTQSKVYRCIPFSKLLEKPVHATLSGPTHVCSSYVTRYTSPSDAVISYAWSAVGGSVQGPSNDSTVSIQWSGDATQRVQLIQTNTVSGCSDTALLDVQPYLPTMQVQGDTIICSQLQHSYALSIPDVTLRWSVTNGTIQGSDSANSVQVLWDAQANAGSIQAVVTALYGSCSQTLHQTVRIVHEAPPQPHVQGAMAVCPGTVYHYSTAQTANRRYRWNVSGGAISGSDTLSSVDVIWSDVTNATIAVSEGASSGCSGADVLHVNVRGNGVQIVGDANPCNLDTAYYFIPATVGMSAQWSASTGTIIGSSTGDTVKVYWGSNNFLRKISVVLTVTDGQCTSTISKSLGPPGSSSVLALPTLSFNPVTMADSIIQLPIVMTNVHCFAGSYAPDSAVFVVRLNKTLFLPTTDSYQSYSDDQRWRRIRIAIPLHNAATQDTLVSIRGYVLLGDSIATPIILDSAIWLDAQGTAKKISTESLTGELHLSGVADDYAGLRLLTRSALQLLDVGPNPGSGQLSARISNMGPAQIVDLRVYNTVGEVVYSQALDCAEGNTLLTLDLRSSLQNGSYTLVLRNDRTAAVHPFVVLK